jgi:hypothetical protein
MNEIIKVEKGNRIRYKIILSGQPVHYAEGTVLRANENSHPYLRLLTVVRDDAAIDYVWDCNVTEVK